MINIQLLEYVPVSKMTEEQIHAHLLGIALVQQYNIQKGCKLFGDRADKAVVKERMSIDSHDTYISSHANTLTLKEKRLALEALLLITEKQDDRIKGRKVAVGSKQRTYDGYDSWMGPRQPYKLTA